MDVKLGKVYENFLGKHYIVTDIEETEVESIITFQDQQGEISCLPYSIFTEYMDDLNRYRFTEI